MAQLSLPTHLKHQPVIAVPYEQHDGHRSGNTDAQFLTVGWAQWDPDKELSAKVLRHSGERWSRQSEELPLTRVVDLAALIAVILRDRDADDVELPSGFFENQSEPLRFPRLDGPRSRGGFVQALETDAHLRRRLSNLTDILIGLREKGAV